MFFQPECTGEFENLPALKLANAQPPSLLIFLFIVSLAGVFLWLNPCVSKRYHGPYTWWALLVAYNVAYQCMWVVLLMKESGQEGNDC